MLRSQLSVLIDNQRLANESGDAPWSYTPRQYMYMSIYANEQRTCGRCIRARWVSMNESRELREERWSNLYSSDYRPQKGALPRSTPRHHPLDDRVHAGLFFRGSSGRDFLGCGVELVSRAKELCGSSLQTITQATWLHNVHDELLKFSLTIFKDLRPRYEGHGWNSKLALNELGDVVAVKLNFHQN